MPAADNSDDNSDDKSASAPRASVVIAAYGRREKTLACIRSVLAQDLARDAGAMELILVDDCSPDGTADAVEALVTEAAGATGAAGAASATDAARVPCRVLRNETNLGANRSRNRGVRAARGELVAFLDSDCIASPDWLRRLIAPFDDPTVGAASGLVEDLPATNIWELAFHGTHRLPRAGDVSRLVIGNLCVRRALLLAHTLDESRPARIDPATGRPDLTVSGRSDEEGLNLAVRAAGWRVIAEPSAHALHDHPYTRRALFRQAWFGGRSAAELVWKYRLGPRKDLGPILAAAGLLALGAIAKATGLATLALVSLAAGCACALLAVAAISFNELRNKGKTPLELARSAPALLVYYAIRAGGYAARRAELVVGAALGTVVGRATVERVRIADLAAALPTPPAGARRMEQSPTERTP